MNDGKKMLDKKQFRSYTLEEDRKDEGKIFTVRMSKEELRVLEEDMKLLHQPKASTALKKLAEIGHIVLHSPQTGEIIKTVFKNKANNMRSGNEIIE